MAKLAVLLVILVTSVAVTQARGSSIQGNPASSTVPVGREFTIILVGDSFAEQLRGGGLDLSFDPFVLEVQSVELRPWCTDATFCSAGTVDNSTGEVRGLRVGKLGGIPNLGGDFQIAAVSFLAIAPGSSILDLEQAAEDGLWHDTGGQQVFPTFIDASVVVVPEPATLDLLLIGLVTLLPVLARRNHQRGR